jgi:hypothetical protein
VQRGDAVSTLAQVGQQAMLTEMQNGRPSDEFVRQCDNAYSQVRAAQRQQYRRLKGR